MVDYLYISKNSEVSISVYRHTLFISLSSFLKEDLLTEVIEKGSEARDLLNKNYMYWGTIFSIAPNFILDEKLIQQVGNELKSNHTEKRKAIALVYKNQMSLEAAIDEYIPILPDEVQSKAFAIMPLAMDWVDSVLNTYVLKCILEHKKSNNHGTCKSSSIRYKSR